MISIVESARLIAYTAHGAIGQTRADSITPYIRHPARVVAILGIWVETHSGHFAFSRSALDEQNAYIAGWLHDVVEDTHMTLFDLKELGIPKRALELVNLLTRAKHQNFEEYLGLIANDPLALTIKCADRISNLEDALADVQDRRGLSIARAANIAADTMTFMAPVVSKEMSDLGNLLWVHARELALACEKAQLVRA